MNASSWWRNGVVWAAMSGATCLASAFVTDGAWPTGNITLRLQMTSAGNPPANPAGGFLDGSTNWNDAVLPALDIWNAHLTRCQLVADVSASTQVGENNGANNVFFSDDLYGVPFGDRTLAVTVTERTGPRGLRFVENDVLFNTAWTWNSYRGSIRADLPDVRRVAVHEIGHVLGLSHPDQDTPSQNVSAIMNSTVGNLETPASDDIAGVQALYGSPLPALMITRQPQNQTTTAGGNAEMSVELGGEAPPPPSEVLAYSWFFTPTGQPEEFLFTFPEGRIALGAAQTEDTGSYYVVVETPDGAITSNFATLSVDAVASTSETHLVNISTRGYAGTGEDSLIVGFVVGGGNTRRVLVRAVGPTLATAGLNVPNPLEDPRLEVFAGDTSIGSNNNWGDTNAAELNAAFAASGAFPLPAGSLDAAIIVDVSPGNHTAIVNPHSGGGRIALVEIYDLSAASTSSDRLINLSTRGRVGTGAEILIAGFAVTGPGPRTFLLRAAGDSLEEFGVNGFLDDPVLRLYSGSTLLRETDDWDNPSFLQPLLSATFSATGAFPFVDRQESAMRLTLNPGLYTLHVAGFNDATGVALVEVYDITSP